MHRCLQLAANARSLTGINPLVGAVLVREGKIIAEAFHEGFGKAHAERKLLEEFRGEILPTDTLYVNLEPCCYTKKKTPPCTEIIVQKGIRRLVFGMKDPNPSVNGKGVEFLRSKGVECSGPILLADCLRLNRGFVSLMTKERPWITLKSARASDGSIANPDGSPKRITSDSQDRWSHEFLRARHDAILVGINTILRDDPKLNVRHGVNVPDPWRIILDPHGKIPSDANVLSKKLADRTIMISASARAPSTAHVPLKDGVFDWDSLWKVLTTSTDSFHGIASILVEGGPVTWKYFKDAGMVDEEVLLVG